MAFGKNISPPFHLPHLYRRINASKALQKNWRKYRVKKRYVDSSTPLIHIDFFDKDLVPCCALSSVIDELDGAQMKKLDNVHICAHKRRKFLIPLNFPREHHLSRT